MSKLLTEKWAPVLNHKNAAKITDAYRAGITAQLLENTDKAIKEQRLMENSGNVSGDVSTFDPVLISLVRRAMPNLIAYDVAGVQTMTMPTGLVFAMQPKYRSGDSSADTDAFATSAVDSQGNPVNAINTAFSGPVATASGEGIISAEMGFDITKVGVTAKTRQLKAGYTLELAQDLKAVHGLDAETELANILSAEILAEINREIIGLINTKARVGASETTSAGTFDLVADADGRWAVEKFKSLGFQIEQEANYIAKATRRGKGNYIICSSNVASALAASGVLAYAPALSTNLEVDDTGNTFAGVLNGRLKVFVDPYAVTDYVTVGYRGTNPYDAGLFYAPYVPLQMVRAVDPATFQPAIAFKTRYGVVANPFATGTSTESSLGTDASNPYFRTFAVANINVGGQS